MSAARLSMRGIFISGSPLMSLGIGIGHVNYARQSGAD